MITIRPAKRQNTPLIIGLAGPTKSGKTMSALRLATGLADGGTIVMLNAEGPRGHLYAGKFQYASGELTPPYRPEQYIVGIERAMAVNPSVLIIDSVSHMHDGPGGILEWHEEVLDRMAGEDQKKRERATFAAWVEPKAAENQFIYKLLEIQIPVILCMRAKEKLRLRKGQEPEFYWGPIVGERVAFETIFTLIFPPHARGIPDLAISDLREPFDTLISDKVPVDEALGQQLAAWARGASAGAGGDGLPSEPNQRLPRTSAASDSHARSAEAANPGARSGSSASNPAGSGARSADAVSTTSASPEATSGGGTGGTRTEVDHWEDQIDNVKTPIQRIALWERIKPNWGSFIGKEQKRLIDANERAKQRVGG